jgi:hypothetical protein
LLLNRSLLLLNRSISRPLLTHRSHSVLKWSNSRSLLTRVHTWPNTHTQRERARARARERERERERRARASASQADVLNI